VDHVDVISLIVISLQLEYRKLSPFKWIPVKWIKPHWWISFSCLLYYYSLNLLHVTGYCGSTVACVHELGSRWPVTALLIESRHQLQVY